MSDLQARLPAPSGLALGQDLFGFLVRDIGDDMAKRVGADGGAAAWEDAVIHFNRELDAICARLSEVPGVEDLTNRVRMLRLESP